MNSYLGSSAQRQEPWAHPWVHVAERAANGGFWTWDSKTDDVYCTDRCRQMYGISPSAYVDFAAWSRRVHPDDRMRMSAAAAEAERLQDTEFRIEFRFLGPSGDCRWAVSHGEVVYDTNGQPRSAVGFDIDITPQRMADEALERSERQTVAGRIAATVAHEINNPLEAVNNLVYLAKSDTSIERIRDFLCHAEMELARVQSISRQTLSFYREDNTQQVFELGEVVSGCLSVLDRRLKAKGAEVTLSVASPLRLSAKRGEILQVLLNLVSNGVEALERGGRLGIHVSQRGTRVRIAVADNGAGITKENRKRLFQPFFTTKGEAGNGLGLWVCRAIVHRHKGTIRVRSNTAPSHSGTLFIVSLPGGVVEATA